ncbi:serine/threonine-protein kinase [Roseateles puraquae]|uniref:serine/threonine-protein kinase n=1 Tax=Roseateles puraquae TaxID=431059 RepID=UPI0031D2ECCB
MTSTSADTASEHARVKALFNEVCDISDPAEQRARLQAAEPDEALRQRVWAMLEADRAEATGFSAPLAALKAAALESAAPELKAGDRLGAWTLSEELGHGGMGRVYLAERSDGHYRQRAAIKLLLGWSTPDALAQLARERQILASLNHPHIARLIDGGTTPRGRPYLVMEYVDGERIDRYCDAQGLGLDARLALFEQVCTAVAHAHRQLIVHCDIKPGNVLVGSDGRAMLLDFGIAHLDGQDGQDGELAGGTSAGLTPRYASPEQQAGEAATPASDIYSLGRMLEELLKPLNPLPRRHELHAIVAHATQAQPADRYLDVSGLLADLRRFRAHLPLAALPRRTGYVATKWLRRRWPWVLVGSAVAAGSTAFTFSLIAQRDRAEAEARTTREVSRFMISLFQGADPATGTRHDVTARELIDKGRAKLADSLKDQPAQRARLQAVLGEVYEKLGQMPQAAEMFEQGLKNPDLAPDEEERLQANLALAYANTGRPEAAIAPARRALALSLQGRPPDIGRIANAENRLGISLTNLGQVSEARRLLASSLERRSATEGELSLNVAQVMHNLARAYWRAGDIDAAERAFRRSLDIKREIKSGDESVLTSQRQLARLLVEQGWFDEGLQLAREVLASYERIYGPRSAFLPEMRGELGTLLLDAGQVQEARPLMEAALRDQLDRAGGQVTMPLATAKLQIGRLWLAQDDPRAGPWLKSTLAERIKLHGRVQATGTQLTRTAYVRWLQGQGRFAEAAAELSLLWEEREPREATDTDRLTAQLLRAENAQALGQWADAARLLEEVGAAEQALYGANRAHWLQLRAAQAMGEQRPVDALPLNDAAWAATAAILPAGHPGRIAPGLRRHALLLQAGDRARAEALLAELAPAAAALSPESVLRRRYEQLKPRQ